MIRGIILGMGKIAQTGHLPAYDDPSLDGLIGITAAVEPNPRSRAVALDRYPAMRMYDTLDECLRYERPDFVDICTPPNTHSAFIEALLPQPIHILCEKPFALEEADARTLAEKLSITPQRVFMGCHQYRFSPVWKQFHDFRHTFTDDEQFLLQIDVYRTEADPGLNIDTGVWRTQKQLSGGGILADTGVHYLYLCDWLFGPPRAVTARTSTLAYTGASVEDTAFVLLEYPKGAAQITCTWAADHRMNSARLVSRRRGLYYNGTTLTRFDDGVPTEMRAPDAADKRTYIGMYADLFREFAQQIARHTQRPEWIGEAYESVRMLQTCYASAAADSTMRVEQ